MRIEDLLVQVPNQVQRDIKEAHKQHGNWIRSLVRDEVRLKLQAPDSAHEAGADDFSVPVRIGAARPASIRWPEVPPELELAAQLARWTPTLRALRDSGNATVRMFVEMEANLRVIPAFDQLRSAPSEAAQLAEMLLARADRFDLVGQILDVNEDVLGAYFFSHGPKGGSHRIELYWAVIGLILRDGGRERGLIYLGFEVCSAMHMAKREADRQREADKS